MVPRWPHTAKRSDGWRTGSTAWNSIMSQGASTKQSTCLQKQYLAESRCPWES